MALFKLAHDDIKGVIVLATENMRCGSVVFVESSPTMYVPKPVLDSYSATGNFAPFYAAFEIFDTLNKSNQDILLDLFGPVVGGQAEQFHQRFRQDMYAQADGTVQPASEETLNRLVKIANIVRINAFEMDGDRSIFALASRISHSCLPNCLVEFQQRTCVCRTILPVRAGEELTIEYNCVHRFTPTSNRRLVYAQTKDFTCHCPRCDAPGDDTRQFPCFDAQCAGRHYCHAPLSDQPLAFADSRYLGVEYVPPHLLPCTDCQRAPPRDHQETMFAQERGLDSLFGSLQEEYLALEEGNVEARMKLLVKAESLPYPIYHSEAIELNDLLLGMHWQLWEAPQYLQYCANHDNMPNLAQAGVRALAPFVHTALFPHDSVCCHLLAAGQACAAVVEAATKAGAEPDFALLAQAIAYLRRALRLHLQLRGRDLGCNWYHTELAEALQLQVGIVGAGRIAQGEVVERCTRAEEAVATGEAVCALCEESPRAAVITLQLCGRCRNALYCSTSCQRAHWKVHRAHCAEDDARVMHV